MRAFNNGGRALLLCVVLAGCGSGGAVDVNGRVVDESGSAVAGAQLADGLGSEYILSIAVCFLPDRRPVSHLSHTVT